MKNWLTQYVDGQKKALDSIPLDKVAGIVDRLVAALKEDRSVFVFGNGGSAANASHFITDLGKGASDKLPKRFRCLSLNDNTAWMTAIGNDYSFDDVFLRQLENLARPGDIVVTMSVSGNSPNLVRACEWAKKNGVTTVILGSSRRGKLADLADVFVEIASQHYGHVEDAHMGVCHMLCYALMENPGIVKL